MRSIRRIALLALLGGALGIGARAQIKSFTLTEMVQAADQAVDGHIVASRVVRVLDPESGSDSYYTTLTLVGRRLYDGQPTTVDVSFSGGFLSPTEGVFNSEAPVADDVQVGKRVIAFYSWSEGGGFAGNTLMAAHGGLYRTVEGTLGAAVLGRGAGYAISANRRLADLESAVRLLASAKPR
jgi:hypothetical protein